MTISALAGAFVFYVLYMSDMSTSFPDGISFSDLENLAESARHEDDCRCEQCEPKKGPQFDGKTQGEVEEIACDALEQALEKCNDPIVHKIIMLRALSNMVDWHTRVGEKMFNDDEERSGICWLRDAGKFQACMDILMNIQIGPEDFTVQ